MATRTGVGLGFAAALLVLAAGSTSARGTKPLPATEVIVAAAADLRFAMDELAPDFERANAGIRMKPTYGSSGNFFSQISNGAPFDLFLSADADYPRRLATAGFGSERDVFTYGTGRLALVVPTPSGLRLAERGIQALLDPSVRHLAIANPKHAPYGRAAEAALRSLGVWDAVKEKLVFGENVAQAAQFVEAGAAEAGVVALSIALAPAMRNRIRFTELPSGSYQPLEQAGIVLSGPHARAAFAFRDYLLSTRGRTILRKFGLQK